MSTGCGPSVGGESPAPATPPPPWAAEKLSADAVPGVYVTEWNEAENRRRCALIAPESLGAGEGGTPRGANFSGGWGIAYDLPDLRSAFGVAGTGAAAEDPSYQDWPNERLWADGSSALYGLEGGTGPNHLAYLHIAGQACLYNIWSRLGQEHLEHLLSSLRYVETGN